jgi:predicted transcriptional regulator
VENLEIIITIVKNWFDYQHINCMPNKNMNDYMKANRCLVNDNYKLIEREKYFEDLNVDGD